ncbi:hypothetical protein GCM10023158_08770 [Gluconacetobacter tumulicola]
MRAKDDGIPTTWQNRRTLRPAPLWKEIPQQARNDLQSIMPRLTLDHVQARAPSRLASWCTVPGSIFAHNPLPSAYETD